jgi:hypothetical protein
MQFFSKINEFRQIGGDLVKDKTGHLPVNTSEK